MEIINIKISFPQNNTPAHKSVLAMRKLWAKCVEVMEDYVEK